MRLVIHFVQFEAGNPLLQKKVYHSPERFYECLWY